MPGMMNPDPTRAAGLAGVGVTTEIDTVRCLLKTTASPAEENEQGQESSTPHIGIHTRNFTDGGLGSGAMEPFGIPKFIMHLVDGKPTGAASAGAPVHSGEGQHGRGRVAGLGDAGKLTFGEEFHMRRENSPGASDKGLQSGMRSGLRSPPGHLSQRRQEVESPLDNINVLGQVRKREAENHMARHTAGLQAMLPPSAGNDSPSSQDHPGFTTLQFARGNIEYPAATTGVRAGKIVARKRIQVCTLSNRTVDRILLGSWQHSF